MSKALFDQLMINIKESMDKAESASDEITLFNLACDLTQAYPLLSGEVFND
jgi:hypothetical protein